MVGLIRDSVDVRWCLTALPVAVLLDDGVGIDVEVAVGIDGDEEEA